MEHKEVENEQAMRKIHFETLFDDFQGKNRFKFKLDLSQE